MTDIERLNQEEDEHADLMAKEKSSAKAANRISIARKQMEMTQPQMAAVMGVSVRTLKNWEGPRYEDLTTPWPPEPACRHAKLLAGIDAMKKRLANDD